MVIAYQLDKMAFKVISNLFKFPHKMREKKRKEEVVKEHVKPGKEVSKDCVRFVCVSDTHTQLEKNKVVIPDGDVLLHAGDFSVQCTEEELCTFNMYFDNLKHRVKLLIAGNADIKLDVQRNSCDEVKRSRDLLTAFVYLEDAFISLYGIKIYGAPWVPMCNGGFGLARGRPLLDRWNLIPDDVNILMTHGPPVGYGDCLSTGRHVGCAQLLTTVQRRVQPRYHVYGHIHEGYGTRTDGKTVFINASVCTNTHDEPLNEPIIFDYPLPAGHTKDELLDLTVTSVQPTEMMLF